MDLALLPIRKLLGVGESLGKKSRRKAQRKRRQEEAASFGFGRALTENKPRELKCPQCSQTISFKNITLREIFRGFPCCGYVPAKANEAAVISQAHREHKEHERAQEEQITEGEDDRTREWHRNQPKYDNGGDF